MTNTGLFLSLMISGTFFLGAYDILQKRSLRRGVNDQFLLAASWVVGALLLAPVLFWGGLPAIGSGFMWAFLVSVVLNVVSQSIFIRALQLSEASLVAPLRLIVSPLVIFTGYLILGEVPTAGGIAGIFVTMFGLWLLLFWDSNFSFRRLFSLEQRGVLLALSGSFLFALDFPLGKQLVINSSGLFTTVTVFFAVGSVMLLLNSARPAFRAEFPHSIKKWWKPVLIIAVLGACGGVLTNQALQHSLAAYASSLKRLWSLWTVLLAGSFLQEKNILQKTVATCIMLAGVVITVAWG